MDTTYAAQPTRFFSSSGASAMIAASSPSPAITTNRSVASSSPSICDAVDPLLVAVEQLGQRVVQVERDAEVAGEQVAGPGRQHGDRDVRPGELGADDPHGAVAAGDHDQVDGVLDRLLGHREPASSSVVSSQRASSNAPLGQCGRRPYGGIVASGTFTGLRMTAARLVELT